MCVCVCVGGSYEPILWTRCIPTEQLEHLRRTVSVCVAGGHSGLHRFSRWKSDFRNSPCAPAAAHVETTKVSMLKIFLCVYSINIILCTEA